MSQHSRLSASSATRWMACPGSVTLADGIVDTNSAAAEEGTKAHALAEAVLLGRSPRMVTMVTGEDHDDDMIEHTAAYKRFVESVQFGESFIEAKVQYSFLTPGFDGFGTADFICIDREAKRVHVVDLKYGHRAVSPENNAQLMLYALGAIGPDVALHDWHITLTIFQPRTTGQAAATWVCPSDTLSEFAQAVIIAAKRVLEEPTTYVATPAGCHWCRAKAICPELARIAKQTVIDTEIERLTDNRLAEIQDMSGTLKAFLLAVDAELRARIERNGITAGYDLIAGTGRATWTATAAATLLGAYGNGVLKPGTLRGIGELKKEFKLSKDQLDELTYKAIGAPSLRKTGGVDLSEFDDLTG